MICPTFPFDQIPPRSIVVVRARRGRESEEDKDALGSELRTGLTDSTLFVADRDTDVYCITEETLKAAGWVRRV